MSHANPLDYLIQCCEDAIRTGHWNLTKFNILNAKDELRRLKKANNELANEAYKANQWAIDEINNSLESNKNLIDSKLKLYVWKNFNPDYSGGLAFAIAYSKSEAKSAVEKVYGNPNDWGVLRVHRIEAGRAEAIGGGA